MKLGQPIGVPCRHCYSAVGLQIKDLRRHSICATHQPCDVQEELDQLASLWDRVAMVLNRFKEWRAMLWGGIDVAILVEETKQLLKDIKTLQKPIRAFPVYQ